MWIFNGCVSSVCSFFRFVRALINHLYRSTDVISAVNVLLAADNVFPFNYSKHLLKHSNQTTSVVFGIIWVLAKHNFYLM